MYFIKRDVLLEVKEKDVLLESESSSKCSHEKLIFTSPAASIICLFLF